MSCRFLILVLGDQLTPDLASLKTADPKRDRVVMCEVMAEATYVRHHKKKIAFLFSAMRHFAEELRSAGWRVDYVRLDDADNPGALDAVLAQAIKAHRPERVVMTEPGEYRLLEAMKSLRETLALPFDILEDDRFIASHAFFQEWAAGRKQWRMENFYHEMRRMTGLLMEDGKPTGGQWNFDAENRKPPKSGLKFPERPGFEPDAITSAVLDLVGDRFADHFGDLHPFGFAVTRVDAEAVFDAFLEHGLASFGDYQDAMVSGERFLFHSLLAPYINCGLLDPLSVCKRVERAYREGKAPLNAVEGFIRQIIGWREYVRGIYWLKMPDYAGANFFAAKRRLPDFFWHGESTLNCVDEVIRQTRQEAYAHHIQRLMVTGLFALLAGIDPHEVHEWYLAVYADAYEWVELPNVIGMSQFADGGLLASKPYAAGGNYINKMSDYCGHCRYDVKKKTGEGACPLNALYWDFLARHADLLDKNPRLGPVYSTWRRMNPETQNQYRADASAFLEKFP